MAKSADPREAQEAAIHAEQAEVASKLALLHDMQAQLLSFRQGLQTSIEGKRLEHHNKKTESASTDHTPKPEPTVIDIPATAAEQPAAPAKVEAAAVDASIEKNVLASIANSSEFIASHSVDAASLYSKLSELDALAARIQQETIRLSEQLRLSRFPSHTEEGRDAVLPMLRREDSSMPRVDYSALAMRFHTTT